MEFTETLNFLKIDVLCTKIESKYWDNKDKKKDTAEKFEYNGLYKNIYQGSREGKEDSTCHIYRQKQGLLDTK